jgi:hypothetical protein
MANKNNQEEFIKTTMLRLDEQLAFMREQAHGQGLSFTCLEPQQLEAKLRGVGTKSPFIAGQSWTSATAAGNAASYNVFVVNPDPGSYYPVYATIYFGLGNFLSIGEGWMGRDRRWPEFSSERTLLSTGSTQTFSFQYRVPYVPIGTYSGNGVIWRGDWHGTGVDYDRGSFDLKVLSSIAMPVSLPPT